MLAKRVGNNEPKTYRKITNVIQRKEPPNEIRTMTTILTNKKIMVNKVKITYHAQFFLYLYGFYSI